MRPPPRPAMTADAPVSRPWFNHRAQSISFSFCSISFGSGPTAAIYVSRNRNSSRSATAPSNIPFGSELIVISMAHAKSFCALQTRSIAQDSHLRGSTHWCAFCWAFNSRPPRADIFWLSVAKRQSLWCGPSSVSCWHWSSLAPSWSYCWPRCGRAVDGRRRFPRHGPSKNIRHLVHRSWRQWLCSRHSALWLTVAGLGLKSITGVTMFGIEVGVPSRRNDKMKVGWSIPPQKKTDHDATETPAVKNGPPRPADRAKSRLGAWEKYRDLSKCTHARRHHASRASHGQLLHAVVSPRYGRVVSIWLDD